MAMHSLLKQILIPTEQNFMYDLKFEKTTKIPQKWIYFILEIFLDVKLCGHFHVALPIFRKKLPDSMVCGSLLLTYLPTFQRLKLTKNCK